MNRKLRLLTALILLLTLCATLFGCKSPAVSTSGDPTETLSTPTTDDSTVEPTNAPSTPSPAPTESEEPYIPPETEPPATPLPERSISQLTGAIKDATTPEEGIESVWDFVETLSEKEAVTLYNALLDKQKAFYGEMKELIDVAGAKAIQQAFLADISFTTLQVVKDEQIQIVVEYALCNGFALTKSDDGVVLNYDAQYFIEQYNNTHDTPMSEKTTATLENTAATANKKQKK